MICGLHLFKNTKAKHFVQKARARKIIVDKLKSLKRSIRFMPFKNSRIICFFDKKSKI